MKLVQLAESLEQDIRFKFDDGDDKWVVKPTSFKEVMTPSSKMTMAQLKKLFPTINKLQTFDAPDMFDSELKKTTSPTQLNFAPGLHVPYVFFLKTAFGLFLVKTEGYIYPKYMIWVK